MHVLREVFYGKKKKRNYEAAAHLRRHGGRRCAGSMIRKRRYKQSAWSHYDRALVSFQRLFVNRSHLRIAGDDVTRTVIGRQLDEHAAMLGHRESDDCLILRNVNFCIANEEIRRGGCGVGVPVQHISKSLANIDVDYGYRRWRRLLRRVQRTRTKQLVERMNLICALLFLG
jgi:hypothetical protein